MTALLTIQIDLEFADLDSEDLLESVEDIEKVLFAANKKTIDENLFEQYNLRSREITSGGVSFS